MAALFVEKFDMRQAEGGSARLDLTGVYFSMAAPGPFPVEVRPHLLVLVGCSADGSGVGALEVRFLRDEEQVARNIQPLQVEAGKFSYQLVQAELTWESAGTVEAHCRIDQGPTIVVPLTVNPPLD